MFIVPGSQAEGVRVQCGVPVVGLSDRPGQQVFVPVLDVVAGLWEVVGGHRHPAHQEPRSSLESGSPHLQPPIPCKKSCHGPGFPLSVMS